MRYGLIGEKLGHSYSKLIHERMADYTYDLIPLNRVEFEAFMIKRDFTAINVTIPYKQAVIPYLDELDPLAEEIHAVNTIVNSSGRLIGYNTDFFGFKYLINNNNIEIKNKKCVILGNGGTSNTVKAVLKHLEAGKIIITSRKPSEGTVTYDELVKYHYDAEVIINTTPVGMYPNIDEAPIDLSSFTSCEAIVDAIFNPLRTKLALQAEGLNIKAVTGLEMLVAQAKQAIEYFLDKNIENCLIDVVYRELLGQVKGQ